MQSNNTSAQSTQISVRKSRVVSTIRVVRGGRLLVGSAEADVADEFPGVEGVVFCQSATEFFQQGLVGGRVGNSNVVDRRDDAATKKVSPDAIGQVPSKESVVRRCHPCSQNPARVFPFDVCQLAAEKSVRHRTAVNLCFHHYYPARP